jgi:plasmid stabilization system protein ParE
MSEFRLWPEAEADLDGIWIRIARESGSADIATRRRDGDFRPGLRSLSAEDYVIIHRVVDNDVVLILHVVHGSRDLVALFGH